ncbi:MAG TPA: ATP-binding protein [Gemmatimonadota bacterium]|nr:ATP-binding protein [Gemmatimonadota bacterium]
MISRLTSLSSTLSFKLFWLLFLSIVLMFAIHVTVSSHFQQQIMENQVRADAARHGDLITQGLFTSMLSGEPEHSYLEIAQVGAEPGIEVVRIYNKEGVVRVSSVDVETGATLAVDAVQCEMCHTSQLPLRSAPDEPRWRTFTGRAGYRILEVLIPVRNDQSCSSAACHAHSPEQRLLGILAVQMSMSETDESLAAARRYAFAFAIVVILIMMLVTAGIVYRGVHVPTRELRRGTQALATGNLDVRIELDRSDELGKLADSFNEMAGNLKAADAELRQWSQTLEDRVRQKSYELEQIHQQIMQVEKAASLGKMAATVAHELNNPLSGILTYAKLASKKLRRLMPDGDELRGVLDNLELIRSESLRCGNIVRDLLTYARDSSPELQRVHLHELIDRALKLVAHHVELKGIETHSDLSLEDDRVICDPEQIVQALIALLINAVEAMPEGGELTMRTGRVENGPLSRVSFSISDTGVGIPPDVIEQIFDPFFSTKDETKGVGLGLAVVYGIVQRHQGIIKVNSERGAGTTFTIEMPRDPERALKDPQMRAATHEKADK